MSGLVEIALAPDSPFREPGLSPQLRAFVEAIIADASRAYGLSDQAVRAAFYNLDACLLDLLDCFEGWLYVRDTVAESLGVPAVLSDTLH